MFCIYMWCISVPALRNTVRSGGGRPNESEGMKSQNTVFRRVIALSAVFSSVLRTTFYILVYVCEYICAHIYNVYIPPGLDRGM